MLCKLHFINQSLLNSSKLHWTVFSYGFYCIKHCQVQIQYQHPIQRLQQLTSHLTIIQCIPFLVESFQNARLVQLMLRVIKADIPCLIPYNKFQSNGFNN